MIKKGFDAVHRKQEQHNHEILRIAPITACH